MINKWLSAKEIADLLSLTKHAVNRKARLENWQYRSYAVRGGKEHRYHLRIFLKISKPPMPPVLNYR